jgi:hypothetical protein
MAFYGKFKYGAAFYGANTLPTSSSFAIFDFCEPTDAVMLTLFAFPQVTTYRPYGAPNVFFDGDNDLCMMSDDGVNSGFRLDTSITDDFTLQFTFKATDLPQNFSDPITKRFFVAGYNRYSKMIGILLSAEEGIAFSRDGIVVDDVMPDSADLFDDGIYYTFRMAVDVSNNRGHLYVTERDLVQHIGHQLCYSFSLQDTPAGEVDHVNVDVLGTVGDPTDVCLDCIRLHNAVVMNHRPIAVPGPDKTRAEGQYASFDGSGSYDPDPGDVIVHYWWTVASTPSSADILLEGSAATAADISGFTNKVVGVVGDFSNIKQGDLFMIGDYRSLVMYVVGDGSWLVVIDHIFPESLAETEWFCIAQSVWDGDWTPSSMHVVLSSGTDPAIFAPHTLGDAYLVLPGAIGDWLNKQHTIAIWNGASWDFTDPNNDEVLYDISANVSYRYLYLAPPPPPHSGIWYADEPKPWELGHWSGRTTALGRMLADSKGLYVVELVVNDGELDSIPVEALLNCYVTDVVMGLTPDLTFIWEYLSDFWDLVVDKEKIESFWSSFAQILSGDTLALWQHDYSKDILSIQRTFQRQWLNYDPLYEEPNYNEIPATIENSVNVSGYSATPNVPVPDPTAPASMVDSETAYDLGVIVAGITDVNTLVLEGICYSIVRVEDGATTVVITSGAIVTGSDRPKAWMIRPTVSSRFSDYTELGVVAGDTALFEVIVETDIEEVAAYVWGTREGVLAFDDTDLSASIADPDTTVRFRSLLRRSAILIDDLVVSVPRLQEVIALDRVDGAPAPLIEERDYRVLDFTTILDQEVRRIEFLEAWFERQDRGFDGAYTAINEFTSANANFTVSLGEAGTDLTGSVLITAEGRFRLLTVVDANTIQLHDDSLAVGLVDRDWEIRQLIEPPGSLWAEITFLDNQPTIEDNFGRLIRFTLDDLEERTDNLDYLSAVQGLWYSIWFGRTLENLRIGSQILLGLPFAEVAGVVIDIKSPHDSSQDRVIVQDDKDPAVIRSYYYPTVVGIADSGTTGIPVIVGDHVDQFDPLSKGVQVDDWESIPNWANDLISAGDMWEPQKIHSYLVKVSSDVFDITNLTFLVSFLLRIKPKYTYPIFIVLKQLVDTVDVGDSMVVGPAIPVSGSYPDTWPIFGPVLGWGAPGPNETNASSQLLAPPQIDRVTPPTFDITTRWPNDRFVTPVTGNPGNPFGNLHMHESSGRVPDGWEGSWGGLPSSHSATRDEGARKYDDYDESGHVIHKYDGHLASYLMDLFYPRDGHMEEGLDPPTFWGKSGAPSTFIKSTAQKYSGSRSLHIVSAVAGEGAYNEFGTSDVNPTPMIHTVPTGDPNGGDPGRQVAVTGWIYIVSGQVVLRLRDQDGATYIAEVRRNQPNGVWVQFVLHHWHFSGSNSPMLFEALSGPAGADFYLDAVECFIDNVPWSQVGYDRSIMGRTGGYSFGGDPDEYFELGMHVLVP